MIRNIFLDRDGIINEVIFRDNKVGSPRAFSEFKLRQEFVEFYNSIKKENYNLFVISNQPDIARKNMDIKELEMMTDRISSAFTIKEITYCTHDDPDNCDCRKPKPGMILELLKKYNLRKEESMIIGDSNKDAGAGRNAGVRTIILQTDYNRDSNIDSDYRVKSLLDILSLIKE